MRNKNKLKKIKGFSLIELIIVIAIIAILAALAIPQYKKAKLSAVVSAHNSDVQTLKSAALIADLDNLSSGDVTAETSKNLDGENVPEVAQEIVEALSCNSNFSVTKSNDGEIIVTPGLVKLNSAGNIELSDSNNGT